jgi:DNA-binding NtrC family response regulator
LKTYKGAIEVKSEEKKGTTFTLYLPSAGDLARLPMPVKKEIRFSQPLPGVIKKILVVDDEEALREICGEILAFAGYEFSLCENGVDALDFMKKDGASIDLVVLDMMMPRMNGHDTFYALRGIKPDLKIILTSGFLDEKEFKGILNEPNIAFVQKPFTDKELLGGISSLCRTGPTGRARHPAGHVARQA